MAESSDVKKIQRPEIDFEIIHLQALEILKKTIETLQVKGYGSYASTQELKGILDEEFDQFKESVHGNNLEQVRDELTHLMVSGLFGLACIQAQTFDF